MKCQTETDDNRARQCAKLTLEMVKDLVNAKRIAETEGDAEYEGEKLDHGEILDHIEHSSYSIMVQAGWQNPSDFQPTNYMILLAGGGPACRVHGMLNQYGDPETAEIQYQDWFTEWESLPSSPADQEILLEFAQCFYFTRD